MAAEKDQHRGSSTADAADETRRLTSEEAAEEAARPRSMLAPQCTCCTVVLVTLVAIVTLSGSALGGALLMYQIIATHLREAHAEGTHAEQTRVAASDKLWHSMSKQLEAHDRLAARLADHERRVHRLETRLPGAVTGGVQGGIGTQGLSLIHI